MKPSTIILSLSRKPVSFVGALPTRFFLLPYRGSAHERRQGLRGSFVAFLFDARDSFDICIPFAADIGETSLGAWITSGIATRADGKRRVWGISRDSPSREIPPWILLKPCGVYCGLEGFLERLYSFPSSLSTRLKKKEYPNEYRIY